MTEEDLDKMIRGAVPKVTITDDRLEHFIDAVLDRTAAKNRGWRWPVLMPALRFAVPMIVAVVLGLTVSGSYAQEAPVAQFSTLYLSTTLVPVES